MEQREVAEAAKESNPNEFSSSDLGGIGQSSVLHSQSDMMLNSAVKMNMDGAGAYNSSSLVAKKKKKKKSKKKKLVDHKMAI